MRGHMIVLVFDGFATFSSSSLSLKEISSRFIFPYYRCPPLSSISTRAPCPRRPRAGLRHLTPYSVYTDIPPTHKSSVADRTSRDCPTLAMVYTHTRPPSTCKASKVPLLQIREESSYPKSPRAIHNYPASLPSWGVAERRALSERADHS
ncbi:unnamed protein product [Rhizoctonia solani]|uniref:Uncharacterized protein n=1 Tax=Rhizoctonia solani TaxID=456999 RepID=A0A8H2WMJ0_9AGAM|nr:unnamed protein product [Rhizoctonia solani]